MNGIDWIASVHHREGPWVQTQSCRCSTESCFLTVSLPRNQRKHAFTVTLILSSSHKLSVTGGSLKKETIKSSNQPQTVQERTCWSSQLSESEQPAVDVVTYLFLWSPSSDWGPARVFPCSFVWGIHREVSAFVWSRTGGNSGGKQTDGWVTRGDKSSCRCTSSSDLGVTTCLNSNAALVRTTRQKRQRHRSVCSFDHSWSPLLACVGTTLPQSQSPDSVLNMYTCAASPSYRLRSNPLQPVLQEQQPAMDGSACASRTRVTIHNLTFSLEKAKPVPATPITSEEARPSWEQDTTSANCWCVAFSAGSWYQFVKTYFLVVC